MFYIWLMLLGMLVLALAAVLAVVIGGGLGALLGAITGGVRGWRQAPEEEKELAAYRGLTWGCALGGLCGVGLAVVLLLVALSYLQS
jgi:hypothetical protein